MYLSVNLALEAKGFPLEVKLQVVVSCLGWILHPLQEQYVVFTTELSPHPFVGILEQ